MAQRMHGRIVAKKSVAPVLAGYTADVLRDCPAKRESCSVLVHDHATIMAKMHLAESFSTTVLSRVLLNIYLAKNSFARTSALSAQSECFCPEPCVLASLGIFDQSLCEGLLASDCSHAGGSDRPIIAIN